MLSIKKLESGYGSMQVLWGVDVEVGERRIVSILGPNGAGKTTLLNTVMGFIKPWSGRILYQNIDITKTPPHKKVELGINIVPEGRRLFPQMSVRENLLLGAYNKRSREKIEDTLELIYNLFPILKERKDQPAGTLSGGEQQMLAIARTLMTRPKIMLLDEPSQGIAPKVVDSIMNVLDRLRDEEKITILLVEQNIMAALEHSDHVYIMDQGRIIVEGDAKEIVSKIPDYLRAFIGL
ncbi:MAG: ATP-binding cassette domain-containing protein [Desulfurococcales archaeon]|jgi:branched-chain amino acid transport system ATP-binding protein|nr:ATP-binding cassette domain-containing protein [Desulfurococcales archaeon]